MEQYLDQPLEVSIETWAKCNASCTFCPYPTMERRGDRMSDELIDELICQMAEFEYPFYFSPFKVNEPLLDKRVLPMCETAITHTLCNIRLFTNGSALTQENCEKIAELERVAHLWVSLNDHRPGKYKDLMGLNFEQTAAKLDALHEMDFPHTVMLSTVGFPNEDFRYYCWRRWPKFESMAIRRTGWLGEIDPQEFPIPEGECSRWWELSIMANGVASLCCMDSEGKYSLGSVHDESLLDIYAKMREHRTHKLRNFHPCNTCNY